MNAAPAHPPTHRRRLPGWLLVLAVLAPPSGGAQAQAPSAPSLPLRATFGAHGLWDDGRAEINVYDAVEIRYGQPRPARVVQIVVKEDLVPESWVKAENWQAPGTVPVLKLNWVLEIPTGVYSYQQMVSVFLRRRDLALVKETLASHEWCGNTWKGLLAREGGLQLEYRTYWEGEASGTRSLDWPQGAIAADSLPLLVRALPLSAERAGRRDLGQAILGPSLIGSRVGDTAAAPATFSVASRAPLPDGPPGLDAALVTIATAAGNHRMWIEASFPNRLLRWERPDGAIYRLVRSRRLAYWNLNDPGDEAHLNQGLRFDPPLGMREGQ